jgi:hypothetical protein
VRACDHSQHTCVHVTTHNTRARMWPLTTRVHEFKCTTHWHEHAFMFQYLDMHTLIKYATHTHTHTHAGADPCQHTRSASTVCLTLACFSCMAAYWQSRYYPEMYFCLLLTSAAVSCTYVSQLILFMIICSCLDMCVHVFLCAAHEGCCVIRTGISIDFLCMVICSCLGMCVRGSICFLSVVKQHFSSF